MSLCGKPYVQSSEKGASASLRNACRECGMTKEAHEQQDKVKIIFGGLERTYPSLYHAQTEGFYPVSIKRSDYLA